MANPTTLLVNTTNSSPLSLFGSAAITATATGNGIVGVDSFSCASFFLNVTAASGTSPTLDVYIQKLLPDKVTWADIIHFTQKTSTGKQVCDFVCGANGIYVPATRTLTAGTQITGGMGTTIRYDMVVGGTNPSFTLTLDAEFYA